MHSGLQRVNCDQSRRRILGHHEILVYDFRWDLLRSIGDNGERPPTNVDRSLPVDDSTPVSIRTAAVRQRTEKARF